MKLTIGADPEVFVSNEAGVVCSGYGMIEGTKDKPFPIKHGAVQVDGMALEFNITPASNEAQFVTNITSVMEQLRGMLPKHHVLEIIPVANFDPEYFSLQPKEARELGCTPDFNAYTGEVNPSPNATLPTRTAAGHVHIGWIEGDDNGEDHFETCRRVVQQLDYCLGLPSLLLDPDKGRRRMYGKAGAFRPKQYGVEYRTLSNFWIKNEKTMRFVYNQIVKGIDDFVDGLYYDEVYPGMAQVLINNPKTSVDNNELNRIIGTFNWNKAIENAQ